MRVVSLLPSATEILCTAGAAGLLVGRSHECDYPSNITHLPELTGQVHKFVSSRQMNDDVSSSLASGKGLYTIDKSSIEELRPDVIITQSLCNVCSVDLCMVERIAVDLQPQPKIMSLNPFSLQDVMDDVLRAGRVLGTSEAEMAVSAMQARIQRCLKLVEAKKTLHGQEKPPMKVAFVEWLDPIFVGGHWTPALIEMAGGSHPLNPANGNGPAAAAGKSFAVPHKAMCDLDPDIIIISPCGLDLKATHIEASSMFQAEWWRGLRAVKERRVAIVDGNQMFNRPGPRLVDALEFLTGLINDQPEFIPDGFPWEWWDHGSPKAVDNKQTQPTAASDPASSNESQADARPCKLTPHPELPADIEDAYQAAIREGSQTYTDPVTGYMVTTDLQQRDRGYCCGNRCRHCPYGHYNVDTELYGPRLNRITAPIHLNPHREPLGSHITFLVWLGGLESHLALTVMLQDSAVNGRDIILVVGTEAGAAQTSWGNPLMSLHDTLQQSKKLGVHMVVVPVGKDLLCQDKGMVCLKVLQSAAQLLQGTEYDVAYPYEKLPDFGKDSEDPMVMRSWSEVSALGKFSSDAANSNARMASQPPPRSALAAVTNKNWEEVLRASFAYAPLQGKDEQSRLDKEGRVSFHVLSSSMPEKLPLGVISIDQSMTPAWDPVGMAVTSGIQDFFARADYS